MPLPLSEPTQKYCSFNGDLVSNVVLLHQSFLQKEALPTFTRKPKPCPPFEVIPPKRMTWNRNYLHVIHWHPLQNTVATNWAMLALL